MKHHLVSVIRIVIGGFFVYMGWTKTQDPVAFLKVIREYQVFTAHWQMNAIAAWLPWFEIWCGVLLVLGIGIRTTAWVVSGLTLSFTGIILWRALQIHAAGDVAFCAIQFDCGCGSGEVLVCNKLMQNVMLMCFGIMVAVSSKHRFSVFPSIVLPASVSSPPSER